MSKAHIPRKLRRKVREQGARCGYCLTAEQVIGTPMAVDHILPESLGGPTTEENLWLACGLCNTHKGNRIAALDPVTGELALIFNPRTQNWYEHFRWSDDGTVIVGLTPTGRATVIVLKMNRAPLVIARQLWVQVGWHPPSS